MMSKVCKKFIKMYEQGIYIFLLYVGASTKQNDSAVECMLVNSDDSLVKNCTEESETNDDSKTFMCVIIF